MTNRYTSSGQALSDNARGKAWFGNVYVTLHSPTQIPFHLVAWNGLVLEREDRDRTTDPTQSAPERSTSTPEAYGEAADLESWLAPGPAGTPEPRSAAGAVPERSAPATLHDAAHALMNV